MVDQVGGERWAGDPETVRVVFDRMPRIVCAVEGPDLVFAAVSGDYRRWVARDELVGLSVREAFPEVVGQHVIELIERALRADEPVKLRDFRLRLTDPATGHGFEVFSDIDMLRYHWPDGSVRGVIVDITDTTETVRRRASENRLVEARRRYAEAREVIERLQQELLPPGVPVLPRVQVSASYLPAEADTAAGGDWFDAFPLPDGRLALAVGDVVGHGVSASAAMGQVRVLIRDRLTESGDPAAAVAAADRMTTWTPAARAATLSAAVLDPDTGHLSYCTAGHPPPLHLPTGGEPRYLAAHGGGPLGTGARYRRAHAHLAEGDMLLLYTDGILERPGRRLDDSTTELARVAADVAAGRTVRDPAHLSDNVTVRVLELLTRATGRTDDIILLAAHLAPVPAALRVELRTRTDALAVLRGELEGWLLDIGADRQDIGLLHHAIGELVTNAIEHAHPDSPDQHPIRIEGELDMLGEVTIEVADTGHWREPRPCPDRGLGLHMASTMLDSLVIDHDHTGTTARARLRLTRPAHLITAPSWLPPQPFATPPDTLIVIDTPSRHGPALRVDGPINAHTTTDLHHTLNTATAAGTRSLTVDLAGVTHLASTGVALLHHLRTVAANNHTELRLHAPHASTANTILTLVDLPHSTEPVH